MKIQHSIIAIPLLLAVSSCYASDVIDYGKVFEGETAEDVMSFVQESGLMDSPDWEIYAIGIDEYLRRCTEEDVYFATKACNLDQIRGAKARTLYWQFLTMAERVLNESAIRQIVTLQNSFEKAREMDLISETNRKKIERLEHDPLSHTINKIADFQRMTEQLNRIRELKQNMPNP